MKLFSWLSDKAKKLVGVRCLTVSEAQRLVEFTRARKKRDLRQRINGFIAKSTLTHKNLVFDLPDFYADVVSDVVAEYRAAGWHAEYDNHKENQAIRFVLGLNSGTKTGD